MLQVSPGAFAKAVQPTQSDVHVDAALNNMSVAFRQAASNFVAPQVFPVIPVAKQSDKYFVFPRGMFNRDEMKKRAPSTRAVQVGYTVSTDTYSADVYEAECPIDDHVRANADAAIQLDTESVELLTSLAMIRQEIDWVSSFFTTTVWTTDKTGLDWSSASSDPYGDVELGKTTIGESTGFEPNTLILGRQVWAKLKNHTDVVDRIKYGQTAGAPATVSLQTLAQSMELDRVLVSRAIKNTAAEGATDVHSYIAGKHALLCYVPPNPGLRTPAAGYTFAWSGLMGSAQGMRMLRRREEAIESDVVKAQMSFDHKKTSADLGYFFSAVVA